MDVDFFTKQFITMKGDEHHYRSGAYRPPVYPEGTLSVMADDHPSLTTEHRTLEAMIRIFCRGNHGRKSGLCAECRELLEYAGMRLEKCPFRYDKPRCSECPVHCYKPDMRERIKAVMRYAGPRMFIRHPLLYGMHYLKNRRKPTT